jgi:hypothetical protein
MGEDLGLPLLLDDDQAVGSALGAHGTPMAILVDADARVASELVAGGPAVLDLARALLTPAASR